MPALTTQKIIMSGNQELFPRDVNGNVLSLIANKANRGQPPTSALTKWYDQNKLANDCTLNNIGGTASSGFNSEVINGKTVYFLKLDGTDDYGAFANTPSLDITTNEFALACTFRVAVGASYGWIINKTLDSVASNQYGLFYDSAAKAIQIFLGSSSRKSISVEENTWYSIIFYRNSTGVIASYINKISQSTATYANALVSQPNVRLGVRSNNVGGTAHANYFKGDIATQTIYQAPTLDINKIIKAETNIAKLYTGVS